MRHSDVIALLSAAALGLGALGFGRYVASEVEHGLEERTLEKLALVGFPQLSIDVDGMIVEVSGRINAEKEREFVLATLESMSGVEDIVDNLVLLAPLVELQPAILRIQKDDTGVTLSGEAPNPSARDLLAARAELAVGAAQFANVMKAQDQRASDAWLAAAEAAIDAVGALRVGQATVDRGLVRVVGAAPDAEAKDQIIARLQTNVASTFSLSVEITAPPPLLSPYVFEARRTDGAATEVLRCAAPDARLRSVILGEMKSLRVPAANVAAASQTCVIANGAPNDAWIDAITRALALLDDLPNGDVTIIDDKISISGFLGEGADTQEARRLASRGWPAAYAVSISFDDEPPVASPFMLTAIKQKSGAQISGHAPKRQQAEAWAALLDAPNRLTVARGAPTGWAQGVGVLISALAEMPYGALSVEDGAATLSAPGPERDRATLEQRLRGQMPPSIDLTIVEAQPPDTADAPIAAPIDGSEYRFQLRKYEDGAIAMDGAVESAVEQQVIGVLARARLGGDAMSATLTIGQTAPPEGWRTAMMAMIGAMADLEEGEASAQPRKLSLTGVAADEDTREAVARTLREKAPDDYELTIDLRVSAVAAAPAGPPPLTPAACIASLNETLMETPIRFPVGKEAVDPGSYPTIQLLIDTMRRCPDAVMEIGAHTDSDGSDALNLALSDARAQRIRFLMTREDGVSENRLLARGYGETKPIASNKTKAGRAKNRRIEFRLIQ